MRRDLRDGNKKNFNIVIRNCINKGFLIEDFLEYQKNIKK